MAFKKSLASILHKKRWLIAIALLVVVLLIAALELTNTTYLLHDKKVPQVISAKTIKKEAAKKKDSSKSSTKGATSTTSSDKTASASAGVSGESLNLIQPYGSLVSNHRPGQNGSDMKEQSACNTTPGATCYIQFTDTSSGKVTKLPEQTADNNGTALWSWDAKTLTTGTWQIKAVANLNGQTKSVTDSIELEIQ